MHLRPELRDAVLPRRRVLKLWQPPDVGHHLSLRVFHVGVLQLPPAHHPLHSEEGLLSGATPSTDADLSVPSEDAIILRDISKIYSKKRTSA